MRVTYIVEVRVLATGKVVVVLLLTSSVGKVVALAGVLSHLVLVARGELAALVLSSATSGISWASARLLRVSSNSGTCTVRSAT